MSDTRGPRAVRCLGGCVWPLLLVVLVAACGDSDSTDPAAEPELPKPAMGVLQFRVEHTLADDSCVAAGSCDLTIEAEEDVVDWLATIRQHSNLAVLHWDRAIPWLVFAEAPPDGVDRVEHYDELLDAPLRDWIDAFADHFARMPRRYLSVSALHGTRDRIAPLHTGVGEEVPLSGACPEMTPRTVFDVQYDDNGQTVTGSFELGSTYLNFVLYLYEKLQPEFLALLVEMNFIDSLCPAQAEGLYALYREIYDGVRAAAGSGPRVFATLLLQHLLAFDEAACFGQLQFEPCDGSNPADSYPEPDETACFPLDLSPIDRLDQGDRLDVLALSFYPDGVLTSPPGVDGLTVQLYPDTWEGQGDCLMRASYGPFVDPYAQIDRFGWTKPIALAETSARSCPTMAWITDPVGTPYVAHIENTAESQAAWLNHSLALAQERNYEFYVQSFLRDYPPLGPWVVQDSLFDPSLYNMFNTWPCSGLFTEDGNAKGEVTDQWLEAL